VSRAQKIITFIETLCAPDGANAGEPIILRDWQKQAIIDVYDPVGADGRRIVRQAVLSIGRKNGKTALVAGICLAHLCGPESIRNGQLYSLSIDSDQASILFNYASAMVYMDEELNNQLNVTESRKSIFDPVSGSRLKVLSGEKKGKMGKSSSFIAFDELAEFGTDRTLYDALITSTGAHKEPIVWVFSTQAPDDKALLSELIDYGEKIKTGDIEDPTFKSFLFSVPKELAPYDEKNWYLANPALGDFRSMEEMRLSAKKAMRMPSFEASFKNLYLNQRVDATNHFITPDVWKACGEKPDPEAFRSGSVYAGIDLSGKNDLTSLTIVARDKDGLYHVAPYFWTPGDTLKDRSERDKAPYVLWEQQGYLEAKPGKTIDYGWVAQKIGELHAEYNFKELMFDRWRIDDLIRELERIGVECYKEGETNYNPDALLIVPFGQGYKDMNPAVEAVEDLALDELIRHGNHPVLTMCAANTVVITDPAGSRKFDKARSTGRIDGMVAMAMALCRAVANEGEDAESVYETRGVLSF